MTALLLLAAALVAADMSYACPTAVLEVNRQYVIVAKNATFDGSSSSDPEGPITKYEWDFDHTPPTFDCDYYETSTYYPDGAFDGKTTHAYDSNGTYMVKLRVTDNTSNTATDIINDVNVTSDDDGDGLPKGWEDLYDFNDANFADADDHNDSDSYNNLCEYLHDSNAKDGSKVPDANYPITIYVPAEVNSIQRAINASIVGDTVMVSKGTYYEAIDFDGASITVTSTDPNDPFVVAATIIDGNESVYHVVTFNSSEDANSVLTGFTITGGNADGASGPNNLGGGIYCSGSSPSVSNCLITDNSADWGGGGLCCANSPSMTITNCFFWDNDAEHDIYTEGYGGAIFDSNASPTIMNCVFSKNWGKDEGGAIYNEDSSPTVLNCTFNKNSAGSCGGGMANSSADPNVVNCIFWGNESDVGDEICNAFSDPNFRHCDIEGCGGSGGGWNYEPVEDGNGNIDQNPGFIDPNDPCGPDGVFGTVDDGLKIWVYSACVDRADGNCTTVPGIEAPDTDITGQKRIDVPYRTNYGAGDPNYVDIGAYEVVTIWFVDGDATGDDEGTSWDDAYTDLQDALAEANSANEDEIWVAEGTYEPNASDRSKSFQLVQNVDVYGGFAATEFARHQRDWGKYETILSGDIGTPNSTSDNSYHVVKGANGALLDGFTITGGNANGSAANRYGGGIYCSYTSPTISNCVITGNSASIYGGGLFADQTCAPVVKNCLFKDNSAGNRGGAMANYASSGQDCETEVSNCAFINNDATYGGAVYNLRSYPTFTNCTFTENDASGYGGAFFNHLGSDATITNCILWDDSPGEIYDHTSSPTVTYCDVEGGYTGTGNINSDPNFADVNNPLGHDGKLGTYDDGLRLSPNSPCIDAADGDTAPSADMVGLSRVDCNIVSNSGAGDPDYADMGA
ncbi:MAG: PKD domain-containing protein, partial [Planctomycetota bacterium]